MSIYSAFRIPIGIKTIQGSLKKYGLIKSVRIAFDRFYDIWFDKKFGIDTVGLARLENLDVGEEGQRIGNQYQPSGTLAVKKVLTYLTKFKKLGFVDYGSGKGQVLLIASTCGYAKVKGIEFSKDLCEIAKRNIAAFKKKKKIDTEPVIICEDAAKYKVAAEDDLFYFFDPFKEELLEKVLQNIAMSLEENPREIIIAYCLPREKHLLDHYFVHLETIQLNEFDCAIYRES